MYNIKNNMYYLNYNIILYSINLQFVQVGTNIIFNWINNILSKYIFILIILWNTLKD